MQINWSGSIANTIRPGARPPLTGDAVWTRAKGGLHMSGQWLKSGDGTIVQLQGVVLSHAQKTCQDIQNPFTLKSPGVWAIPGFFSSIAAWNINCVKFQLNPRMWANICPRGTGDQTSAQYRTMVTNAVTAAQAAGLYVIITNLDYYLPGGGNWPANDTYYTPTFWAGDAANGIPGIASLYANDQTVLFETFSEPHSITGPQWLSGGTIQWTAPNGQPGPTFTSLGVQGEINTIASVAPNSVILVDQKDFDTTPGGEFSGYYPTGTYGWSAHIYDSNNNSTPYKWDGNFGNLASATPMVATEFGDFNVGSGTYLTELLNYFKTHLAGWTAFTYDDDPRQWIRPSLLHWNPGNWTDTTAYANGNVSDYGAIIQSWYLSNFHRM